MKLMKSTLADATADMDRALREHEPDAVVARCGCDNIALAFVQNPALGVRYARCLACGTNVSLQFGTPDAGRHHANDEARAALRGASKLTDAQEDVLDQCGGAREVLALVAKSKPFIADELDAADCHNLACLAAVGLVYVTCVDEGGHWYASDAGRDALRGES